MVYLCFDTSGEKGCVTVVKNGEIAASLELSKIYGHNETLMPSVELIFENLKLTPSDIKKVAFVRGPGSFTGLRIGIAAAYGIAAGNSDIELTGYTSLYLHARDFLKAEKPVLVLLDARKRQVYSALFSPSGLTYGYVNIYPDEIGQFLSQSPFKPEKLIITGSGFEKYSDIVKEKAGLDLEYKESRQCLSSSLAEELLEPLGFEQPSIEPLYIRKSDAEVNRDKKCK